jgi:CRP/FNR family transcriptional regulator, cyclic AMP receptor protein
MQWRLLGGLAEADRTRVLAAAVQRQFTAGEVIFHEGEAGTSLHLLEAGRVAIRVTTPEGDTATLTVVAPGDVFGEMALLRRSSTRTATAVALEGVTTLALEQAVFARLCSEQPSVERLLIGVLASRVERLSRHLNEALYLSVDKRIMRRLIELSRVYGTSAEAVTIPLTQEDLAGLAGTTRPTVNTLLRKLQDEGVVALTRGRITILNAVALDRAAR